MQNGIWRHIMNEGCLEQWHRHSPKYLTRKYGTMERLVGARERRLRAYLAPWRNVVCPVEALRNVWARAIDVID